MTQMINEASTAPSSINMQPWRFLVVDTPEGKDKLVPLSRFNKEKVAQASAVIAVFADKTTSIMPKTFMGKPLSSD